MAEWYDHDELKGRKLPNRGYLFEAIWAAAVAARFYKRIGDLKKMQRRKGYADAAISLQRLPKISYTDTNKMLTEIFSTRNRKVKKRTENDVWFDSNVKDYLLVSVGVSNSGRSL